MKKEKVLNNEKVKRMKELCLNDAYICSGDMYKLLNSDILKKLVNDISAGDVKLSSDIVYGRDTITKEEKFLDVLDKYIWFVKNNYYIETVEQRLIIELSLKNKYSKILYSLNDYHKGQSYNKFIAEFMKMFWFNFYNNIMHFSKSVNSDSSISNLMKKIENFDFEKDIIEIDRIFKPIICNRNNNLVNSFKPYKEIANRDYNFFLNQVDWVIEDFYKNKLVSRFNVNDNDNYIIVNNNCTLLLNIVSDYKKTKNDNELMITFGIKNNNFCVIVTDELFEKQELDYLLKKMKGITKSKYLTEEIDFINPTLRFKFLYEDSHQWLDIFFEFNDSGDYYVLSLNENEIIELYNVISRQTGVKRPKKWYNWLYRSRVQ